MTAHPPSASSIPSHAELASLTLWVGPTPDPVDALDFPVGIDGEVSGPLGPTGMEASE